jgi:hypothetical protein
MLRIVSTKSLLLLGVAMALCAFALPSVASAASWAPVGTSDGRIASGNLGFSFTPPFAVPMGWVCTASSFNVTVDSAAVATITGVSFADCHGVLGTFVGCTTTATAINLPWRATPVDTTRIEIHGVNVDVSSATTPGTLNECPNTGLNVRWTGTPTVSFTPGAAGARRFDFNGTTGLSAHYPGFPTAPFTVLGTAVPTGLLNIIM